MVVSNEADPGTRAAFAPTLAVTRLPGAGALSAFTYRCTAGPHDRPYVEWHRGYSLAYIHHGSFACHCRGRRVELATGSLLVGCPGDAYSCVHDHHACGDAGVVFEYGAELVDQLGAAGAAWHGVALPPLAEVAVLGELARAAAAGVSAIAPAEAGLLLGERFAELCGRRARAQRAPTAADRRRVLRAAQWLDAHCTDAVDLAGAAEQAAMSVFHFLRLFRRVLGVTPHQYLIRCRLRCAARLLAEDAMPITEVAFASGFGDLSNFVRTFGRAARVSPRRYRQLAAAHKATSALRAPVCERFGAAMRADEATCALRAPVRERSGAATRAHSASFAKTAAR